MSDEYWKLRDDIRKGRIRENQETGVPFIPPPSLEILNGPILRRHSNVLPLEKKSILTK